MEALRNKDGAYRLLRAFLRRRGFAADQIESFDRFVFDNIPEIIAENPEVSVLSDTSGLRHTVRIHSVTFDPPSVVESNGARRYVTPTECLQRRMHYTLHAKIRATYRVVNKTGKVTYEREVYNHVFDHVPCMKKSQMCNLLRIDANDAMEDEREAGGYFVINGQERVLIGQEKVVHNHPIVSLEASGSAKLEIRSVRKLRSTSTLYMNFTAAYPTDQEDARRCVPGSVTVHIPFITEKPDVAAVFRMLNVDTVEAMLDHVCAPDDPSWFVERVRDVLTADPMSHITSPANHIARLVKERVARGGGGGADKIEASFRALIRDSFLPQQGHSDEDTPGKIVLFADMLRTLLRTVYFLREPDDRDDYANRHVALSASLLTIPFRSAYSEWRSKLAGALKHCKGNHVPMIEDLLIGGIGVPLIKACNTGNVNTTTKSRSGASNTPAASSGVEKTAQQLARIGLSAPISHIQRLCNPVSGQAIDARIQDTTSIGIVDPHETPDTKECGLMRNKSAIAGIRHGYPHDVVVKTVMSALGLGSDNPIPRRLRKKHPVYVSGKLVGEISNPINARRVLRSLREAQDLPPDVSIFVDDEDQSLRVNAEPGSLWWPLVRLDRIGRLRDLLATHKGLDGLWDQAVACGAIEYINKDEERHHVRVALTYDEVGPGFTHVIIHPSQVLSVFSSRGVLAEFNSGPRIVYTDVMMKPAPAAPPSNRRARFDTSTHSMLETHRPLVGTLMDDVLQECPVQNCIIAIMCNTGYSIEDSLIFNRAAVDRGMLRGLVEKSARTGVHMGDAECEQMSLPPESASRQLHADYSKVDPKTGIVPVGTRVTNNDILMSKIAVISTRGAAPAGAAAATSKTIVRDRSTVFKSRDEVATVSDTVRCKRLNGESTYRVRTSMVRRPEPGCKYACLTSGHQVLCANGNLVDIADVTTDMVVACLNAKTDTVEYHKPSAVHRYDRHEVELFTATGAFGGPMFEVTSNHRLCIRDRDDNITLSCADYTYFEYGDIHGDVKHCTAAVNGIGNDIPLPDPLKILPGALLSDLIRLLGFLVNHMPQSVLSINTDYTSDKASSQYVQKHILRPTCRVRPGGSFRIPHEIVVIYNRTCQWGDIPDWAFLLSKELSLCFLEGFFINDRPFKGFQKCNTSNRIVAIIQHAGLTCRLTTGDRGSVVEVKNTHYRKVHTTETNFYTKNTAVYCLTVPTGIFCVTPRLIGSGSVSLVWTGNSRHGQKGTVGRIVPPEDMPTLSRTGMAPDILFNTHTLPSRMTPGKIIEMFLGRLAIGKGEFIDGTPFTVSEEWGGDSDDSVIQNIGKALEACGMRSDGQDAMFDGISGKMMEAEVFVGPCSIMKLNHDVQSKVHARARGPKVIAHRQPVEGRAVDGGNRYGEMEGHGAVSHGASGFMHDRHMECSDKRYVPMCVECGLPGAVGPKKLTAGAFGAGQHSSFAGATYCHNCQKHNTAKMVPTPGGFHLLNHSFAAVHVKMRQRLSPDAASLPSVQPSYPPYA